MVVNGDGDYVGDDNGDDDGDDDGDDGGEYLEVFWSKSSHHWLSSVFFTWEVDQ